MKNKTGIYFILILYLVYIIQIRINPLDNQSYFKLYNDYSYGGLLIDPVIFKVFVISMSILYFPQIYKTFFQLDKFILFFYGLAIFSILWSIDIRRSFSEIIDILALLFISNITCYYLGIKNTIRFVWIFASIFLLVCIVFALAGLPYALMSGIHEGSWRGLMHHKNVFGPVCALVLVFSILGGRALNVKKTARFFVIAVSALGLYHSNSLSAVILVPTSVLVAMMSSYRPSNAGNQIAFAVLLIASVSLGAFWASIYLEPFVEYAAADISLSGRTTLWHAAMPFTLTAPFGYGIGTSGGDAVIQAVRFASGWAEARSVHNSYLRMALDVGWPACLVFIVWLVSLILRFKASQSDDTATLICAVATIQLVGGMTEVSFGFYPSLSLFTLLVLCFGKARQSAGLMAPLPSQIVQGPVRNIRNS